MWGWETGKLTLFSSSKQTLSSQGAVLTRKQLQIGMKFWPKYLKDKWKHVIFLYFINAARHIEWIPMTARDVSLFHLCHPTHSKYRHWSCGQIQHLVTMLVSLAWCEALIHLLKTFLPKLLPYHSAALAFLNRVGFLLQTAVWFLTTSWTAQRVRALHKSRCSSLGSGEGLKERVQDLWHPWRSGMGLASLEG